MSQKLQVNNLEWINYASQCNEDFIKNESDEQYFLEVDIQYPEIFHELHNNLPFLPERLKIGKVEKLVATLHDKTEYAIHIRNLKQALHNALVFSKKVYKVIDLIKMLGLNHTLI